ncbi:DNA repair protein RecN [Enterococcus timonensis]|uniref:DNA repair protein RecN n=1 Tax=Enterococcus timonensis TaxID=1852364 RepID=UPI0008DB1539|nr:DNA repair protein RecN [Enterococcus timonensis]
MLLELSIHDFAIISKLRLNFQGGMSALTGETGAGKSIIIDAVGLLLGARGSADFLRKGAAKCTLEGLFTKPNQANFDQTIEEMGLSAPDDQLVIQREILASGKNICRVNGHLVTISQLKQLGIFLVDIQGQHDTQALLQVERHLPLLDEFGKKKIAPLLKDYQEKFQEYKSLAQKVAAQKQNEKAFAQRIDMLSFQSDEIEQAQLVADEEEGLIQERNQLGNYQKIMTALAETYQTLESDWSVSDQLGTARSVMETIADIHPAYQEISESLDTAFYAIQEAIPSLNAEIESLEFDEERLNQVEERLEIIFQLKRKYGEDIPAILKYWDEISEELAAAGGAVDVEALEKNLQAKKDAVLKSGQKLQQTRQQVAVKMSPLLKKELQELYMEHTQFEVRFTDLGEHFTKEGLASAEFFIQTNVGEDLKPLVKVASGGELSRLLLGLKSLFAKSLGVTSIVFDEVDSGVSGRVATAIANKIHHISQNSQVLCITHLPQVAAVSDQQYLIEKEIQHGRTETKVRLLDFEKRVEVLAKMIGGQTVTPISLEHAKELLVQGENEQTK